MEYTKHLYSPIFSSPPSDTIKDIMFEKNIEKIDLYDALGLLWDDGERFLNDEIQMNEKLATRLAEFIGSSKEFWIARYERYERSTRAKNGKGI
jgi:plasmid maintenance system antidote protein VapI